MTATLAETAEKLKTLKSAVIFCHMRPDGDAIGSAMGLKRLLEKCGVHCSVACESPIPKKFTFLPGTEAVCGARQYGRRGVYSRRFER